MTMQTVGVLWVVLVGGCAVSPGGDAEIGGGTTAAGEMTTEGSGGGHGETTTTGEVVLRGACAAAERVGGFSVSVEEDYSAFSGVVADGVVPITVHEQVAEGGACVLLRRNNPICDPPCQPGTTCDFTGECIPYPTNHDVGTVSVAGLVQPVEVMPVMATFDYFDTTLMHPAFSPGVAITLSASGGDYSPFTLHGEGVAMIEPASEMVTMKKGQALRLEWAAAADPGAGQIHVELTIDQHGNTPVKLVCDGADSGRLEVPGELIAQFVDFGISGFPSAQFYRQTADSLMVGAGCVDFTVRSHRETLLAVEGHTPCNKPADCPDGQMCDIMIQTCK